jgi:hypothetical protein
VLGEPLSPVQAKQLIREILENGAVSFSKHAEEELAKDKLTMWMRRMYCEAGSSSRASSRTARGGIGSRRPHGRRCRVPFRSELRVVTAWRVKS